MNPNLGKKAKEIRTLAENVTQKLTLLDTLLDQAFDPKELIGISIPVEVEELLNVYRIRIKKGEKGVTGFIHVPKKPGFRPEKVVIIGKARR